VISSPKTFTWQRRDCDLNPGPSAPESSMLTTQLPSHPRLSSKFAIKLYLKIPPCLGRAATLPVEMSMFKKSPCSRSTGKCSEMPCKT